MVCATNNYACPYVHATTSYPPHFLPKATVVATICRNSTCSMLTSAKLSVGYLVVGITRELIKKLSLHYYLIYISYK